MFYPIYPGVSGMQGILQLGMKLLHHAIGLQMLESGQLLLDPISAAQGFPPHIGELNTRVE